MRRVFCFAFREASFAVVVCTVRDTPTFLIDRMFIRSVTVLCASMQKKEKLTRIFFVAGSAKRPMCEKFTWPKKQTAKEHCNAADGISVMDYALRIQCVVFSLFKGSILFITYSACGPWLTW